MAKLEILQHKRGRKSDYVGLLKFKDVMHLINTNVDYSMNRDVDRARIDEIINYIEKKQENLFFPPVILNIDSGRSMQFNQDTKTISIPESVKIKVIDGQHRLTAIKTIFEDVSYKKLQQVVKDNMIPFVIIEGLDPEEHRELFNDINQNAEKVNSVVSERFNTTVQNAIALKYLSTNKKDIRWIEWEKEQSEEKVVYLHMLKSLNTLIKYILRKSKIKKVFYTEPYHDDEDFYKIQFSFLNTYFNILERYKSEKKQINDLEIVDETRFFVKRVTIKTITDLLIESLDSIISDNDYELNLISQKIEEIMNNIIPEKIYFPYKGKSTQVNATYDRIKMYLLINKYIFEEMNEEDFSFDKGLYDEFGIEFETIINSKYDSDDFNLSSIKFYLDEEKTKQINISTNEVGSFENFKGNKSIIIKKANEDNLETLSTLLSDFIRFVVVKLKKRASINELNTGSETESNVSSSQRIEEINVKQQETENSGLKEKNME